MLDYKQIGQKIRSIRKSRELSQEQLAEKVWISVTHMSHIETGQTKLSLPVLVDLADALQVTPGELLAPVSSAPEDSSMAEIQQILSSCTPDQLRVLERIIKATRDALNEQI